MGLGPYAIAQKGIVLKKCWDALLRRGIEGMNLELFLAISHVVAATMVSIHVLLTHREVRSSIGWIGLSWLSPFVGSSIYIAFGVNRVVRRVRRTGLDLKLSAPKTDKNARVFLPENCPDNILSIAAAANTISGLPLTDGNSMEFLCQGDAAYPQMLDAIDKAQHSIAMASYIFANDKIGRIFVQALVKAKARGVDVRVLVDGVGSGYFRSPIVKQLNHGRVSARRFLHKWAPWAMTFINLRNHKKLLIIDGKIGFTGGMNIADENLSDGALSPAVQDIHARIEGPVVAQLLQTFERDWVFTTRKPLTGDKWWPIIEQKGNIAMRGIVSGPDDSVGKIESLFASAVEQAQHRVRIVTPYFLPEDRLFEVIRRASMRGVVVEIMVPEKSNHFYFDWAIAAHLATFSLESIDCYLMEGAFDHSKLMSVDGHWCSIGSANWDARSMRLNFEFQVECYDQEATVNIDSLIDQKRAKGRLLDQESFKQRPMLMKLRDAAARLFLPYL